MSDSTRISNGITMLPEEAWRERARVHEQRMRTWTDPHLERASRGEKHPVYDFLFNYYAYRASWLKQWHPGPGVALLGDSAQEFLRHPEYIRIELPAVGTAVIIDPSRFPAKRREFLGWLENLLAGMQNRPAFFGCHGMHEWAMVYHLTPEEIRHSGLPLRYPPETIASIVENRPPCCTHFDAFRFFTPDARPLNRQQPSRETIPMLEQSGCLHANMDLYKWAFKLSPFTPADLLADCFELAKDIREVDMRASPYDVSSLGFSAIPIETETGRIEYEALQRGFSARGDALRVRLLEVISRLGLHPPR